LFAGWLLQRQVTEKLALGAEVFHQTADTDGGQDSSGFNIGGVYDLTGDDHLLLSLGRGIQNASATNRFSYYLAYQRTF
jgi:hydrogenase/urease accessory protein HupE